MKILVLTATLLALASPLSVGQELSPEGKARKAAHEFLFGEYAQGKELKLKGTKPNQILDEIIISRETIDLEGDVRIELPAGSQRVAGKFRYLLFRGEGLDNLEGLKVDPYSPNGDLPISTQKDEIYRVKVGSMPPPSKNMPPMTIVTRCKPGTKAVIREIAFNSQSKLSVHFDDIPYRNLGAEHPREQVKVDININCEFSIDGHVDLEREKFCRYYAAPGNLHSSFEEWAAERNFLPGRQIFKLQPGLVKGYSPNQPKLKESEAATGAADPTFFQRYDASAPKTIPAFENIPYAMCLNDYPDFMSVPVVGRGTPLIEHFDKAADLASDYIQAQVQQGGRTATWWEVKNESTIKAEWDYHFRKDTDSWALMAELHNQVADAVHEKTNHVNVGGPSSAWMQVQVNQFGLYKNQIKFMDLTRDHLDFYSHHFYEDIGSLGVWERRKGKYTNYLLGRMEAILDMFAAHMHETDNQKPILITECGSLQSGVAQSDYWLRLRSWSAYMHKLMNRPEQIELAVPFAFMQMPWNPQSGNVAFIPKKGQNNNCPLDQCDSTPVSHFFDLWREFDGRRLLVDFDRDFLDITAVHKNNRIQIAATNMGGQRLSLDLSSLKGKVQSAIQRRLIYWDGEVNYEDAITIKDLGSVPVNVEETTIIILELNAPIQFESKVDMSRRYATGTATPMTVGTKHTCQINVDDSSDTKKSKLLIGVQNSGGLAAPLRGTINGHEFIINKEWAGEFNNLFANLDVEVPPNWLKQTNQIEIEPQKGVTITSVSLEIYR